MSFELILKQGVQFHEQGQLDEAEKIYRQLLEMSPENSDLLHLLGMIAMQRKSFNSAVDLLYKALSFSPQSVMYEFTLAQALSESGHLKESIEHYNQVILKDDSIPESYHNLGLIYRSLGEIEKAKELLYKSLDLKSDFSSAYVNLALIARYENQFETALEFLEKAKTLNPQDDEAIAQLGVTHRLLGNYETALEFYEKALEMNPNVPIYWNGLGITYEHLERLDLAMEAYTNAITLDSLFADAYSNRANVYVKQGHHWKAEDDYKKAVKIDPEFASAYNNLGALLYEKDRQEEALECYRKAFIINPKQAETCSNLAMAVKDVGDFAEAIGLYFNALSLDSSKIENHHYLAQTLYDLYTSSQEGSQEMAVKLARKYKEFFPNNPIAEHVCNALEGNQLEEIKSEYITNMFDAFAATFEKTLANVKYRMPELLEAEMKKLPLDLKILDAGCGTGLCAKALKKNAKELVGVDISEKMLEVARKKQLYTHLEQKDISLFLEENKESFDCIVLTDVLCYFGDLSSLLQKNFSALKEDGIILFSLEKTEERAYLLQASGRFAHQKEYVEEVLNQTGFKEIQIKNEALRQEKETFIQGLFVLAKKTR